MLDEILTFYRSVMSFCLSIVKGIVSLYKGHVLLFLRNQPQNVTNMDVMRTQALAVLIMP